MTTKSTPSTRAAEERAAAGTLTGQLDELDRALRAFWRAVASSLPIFPIDNRAPRGIIKGKGDEHMTNATISKVTADQVGEELMGYRVNGGGFQCLDCIVDAYEAPYDGPDETGRMLNEQGDSFMPILGVDLDSQGCRTCGAYSLLGMIAAVRNHAGAVRAFMLEVR